eukprot:2368640-Rhodomonas_salina.1
MFTGICTTTPCSVGHAKGSPTTSKKEKLLGGICKRHTDVSTSPSNLLPPTFSSSRTHQDLVLVGVLRQEPEGSSLVHSANLDRKHLGQRPVGRAVHSHVQ